MGFIYKITNTISGKHYIGETVQANPENRWKKHIHSLKTTKGCPALKDAMKKYGVDKFKFEIIIICFDDDRYKYEKEYIKKFNSQVPNGYNILLGGEIGESRLGIKHTDEAKKKMSDAHKRRNEANVNYIKKYKKEDTRTVAEKENDTKNKIKDSVLLYYKNGGITKHREAMIKAVGRKISQYSKENIFIKEYNSITEAARCLNLRAPNIHRVLNGTRKTLHGFIWKYI
jgi:group I intron endonuclease